MSGGEKQLNIIFLIRQVVRNENNLTILFLTNAVAVIQWVTSSHKNHMTIRVITSGRVHVTSLIMPAVNNAFLLK